MERLHEVEARYGALAVAQSGFVSRAQLLDSGLSESAIDERCKWGELVPHYPGVFRLAIIPTSQLGDVWAAQLWAPDDAFFSHQTGAWIWGLDGAEPNPVEICVYDGNRVNGIRSHRLMPTDRPAISPKNGMLVASIDRCLLDLGASVPPWIQGRALDDALRKKLTTLPGLRNYLDTIAARGRNGTVAMRKMLDVRDGREGLVESRMETKMLRILRSIKFSNVVPQHEVRTPQGAYRLDFAFPDLKIGIECHSIRWHMGDEAFKKDVARDRHLSLLGWVILYFCWDDIVLAPERVRFETETALRNALNLPA